MEKRLKERGNLDLLHALYSKTLPCPSPLSPSLPPSLSPSLYLLPSENVGNSWAIVDKCAVLKYLLFPPFKNKVLCG
jgi:hypothetical protein